MALFAKEEKSQRNGSDEWGIDPVVPKPAAEPQAAKDFQAHLGQGSRIDGKLTFEGSVRIDGNINGEINAKETVVIGDSAVVTAQIQANVIIIHGKVSGDVTARKRIELRAPARLTGNINTPSLVIHEGVAFEGHCTMGGAEAGTDRAAERKVAFFPKEERAITARASTEAVS